MKNKARQVRRNDRPAGQPTAGAQRLLRWIERSVPAEESVARALSRLLRTWPYFYVLNGFALERGAVDHIVVGPMGVFVVDTEGYTGTVRLNGNGLTVNGRLLDRDPLPQVLRAAAQVRAFLHHAGTGIRRVQPVICLPYARLDRPQCANRVLVTRREHLGYFLRHWQDEQLDPHRAARVFDALRLQRGRAAA